MTRRRREEFEMTPSAMSNDKETDAIIKKRQRDCKRHPAANITSPGCPPQCGFCGMSLADQETYAAEQAAWAQWAGSPPSGAKYNPNQPWPGTPAGHPSLNPIKGTGDADINPLSNTLAQPVKISESDLADLLNQMRKFFVEASVQPFKSYYGDSKGQDSAAQPERDPGNQAQLEYEERCAQRIISMASNTDDDKYFKSDVKWYPPEGWI